MAEWARNRLQECPIFDRWWLVECENAEAGRATIAASRCDPGVIGWETAKVGNHVAHHSKHYRIGRILASGGAHG